MKELVFKHSSKRIDKVREPMGELYEPFIIEIDPQILAERRRIFKEILDNFTFPPNINSHIQFENDDFYIFVEKDMRERLEKELEDIHGR